MTPPCTGQPDLFDSTHPVDHARAAALCATCPIRLRCNPGAMGADWPVGTWGGVLYGGQYVVRGGLACGLEGCNKPAAIRKGRGAARRYCTDAHQVLASSRRARDRAAERKAS